MGGIVNFLQRNFAVLIALAIGWIFFVVIASALYRRVRGKYLLLHKPTDLTFSEDWTSGSSLQSSRTRLGGARNCLFVGVNSQSVYVLPHFPFNLMFLPEIFGLEYIIPRNRIRQVASESSAFGNTVRVAFTTDTGATNAVALRLRHPEQFMQAVGVN